MRWRWAVECVRGEAVAAGRRRRAAAAAAGAGGDSGGGIDNPDPRKRARVECRHDREIAAAKDHLVRVIACAGEYCRRSSPGATVTPCPSSAPRLCVSLATTHGVGGGHRTRHRLTSASLAEILVVVLNTAHDDRRLHQARGATQSRVSVIVLPPSDAWRLTPASCMAPSRSADGAGVSRYSFVAEDEPAAHSHRAGLARGPST
jgi:hypothetical protein